MGHRASQTQNNPWFNVRTGRDHPMSEITEVRAQESPFFRKSAESSLDVSISPHYHSPMTNTALSSLLVFRWGYHLPNISLENCT